MNRRRVVDGGRSISIVKPLPVTSAGSAFRLTSSVLDIGDKGKAGTTIKLQHKLWDDSSAEVFAIMTETAFYLGQGGWGGPKGKAKSLGVFFSCMASSASMTLNVYIFFSE